MGMDGTVRPKYKMHLSLLSASAVQISYCHVNKCKKALPRAIFLFKTGHYGYHLCPEFHADFRSEKEKESQNMCPKKDYP
jgi:hypothetical protein